RAPALQPGTALFTFEQPSLFVTHYSDAGFAFNILYHYQTEDGSLPYWFFSRRFHFDYKPDMWFKYQLRGLVFEGNTSDGIAVLHQEGAKCLRVLDQVYTYDRVLGDGRDVLLAVSNPDRILADPNAPLPDPEIFGPEPAHNWCYFFEKADLARQVKDWQTVLSLYKQAKGQGLAPEYGAEYVPFIEAYAQTGEWQKAYDMTLQAQDLTHELSRMLCANWLRFGQDPSADMKVINQLKRSLSCSKY
ncbi:MAG TPA: hypothetical protein VK249_00170, partial [Anaerolineales bacterium]|nr:hypothetical protein [Anaerolineales bacterium]